MAQAVVRSCPGIDDGHRRGGGSAPGVRDHSSGPEERRASDHGSCDGTRRGSRARFSGGTAAARDIPGKGEIYVVKIPPLGNIIFAILARRQCTPVIRG